MSAAAAASGRRLTRRDRLALWFAFLGPPALWSLHLVVVYGYEEAACATGRGVDLVEPLVIAVSVILGAGVAAGGAVGYVLWRATRREVIADPRGRVAFMSAIGAIWSGIFLLIILFSAMQLIAFQPCRAG